MTVKIRRARSGETLTTIEGVRHFQICSTGPRPNTRTLLVYCRYDFDDEQNITLGENDFVCIDE